MKIVLNFLFILLITKLTRGAAMTEAQLQNAAKLIRNVCQPKLKISDETIDEYHKGNFVEDEKLMCYLECVFRMGKLTKNGKFDKKNALAQIPTLPTERQQPTKEAIKSCSDKGQDDDKCKAAFELAKCVFNHNPQNYFLP